MLVSASTGGKKTERKKQKKIHPLSIVKPRKKERKKERKKFSVNKKKNFTLKERKFSPLIQLGVGHPRKKEKTP